MRNVIWTTILSCSICLCVPFFVWATYTRWFYEDGGGCCSHHGGIRYVSSEGAYLCADWTISECVWKQPSNVCHRVSEYTDKDFLNISRVMDKDSRLKNLFEYIQERLRELRSIWIKIRWQSTGASESLITARVARAEASIRDQYCESRDSFITLAQGYIFDDKITHDLSKWDNTSFGDEIVSNVEKNWDTIGELLKKGDRAYRSERFSEAIENYEEAVQYLRPDTQYSELVEKIDHNIRIAKRRLLKEEEGEKTTTTESVVKQPDLPPDVGYAKSKLGRSASNFERLVPTIKRKSIGEQKRITQALEVLKTYSNEDIRNFAIYLSYLLK